MITQAIGYEFNDVGLLRLALTHRSRSSKNNERLEFLGDSVLSTCISKYLFEQTEFDEGQLSVMRSQLVSRQQLNLVGQKLQIDRYLRLAEKQAISDNIRADAVEALIGAMYLDGGIDAPLAFITDYFLSGTLTPRKDGKTRLQEWAHRNKQPLPVYELVKTEGQSHNAIYTTNCKLQCGRNQQASASTKQAAEQKAASLLCQQLMEENE